MSEAMLGCPHCAKPVGFVPVMARQVVACPHCQGQFQMPERLPAAPVRPPGASDSPSPSPGRRQSTSPQPDPGLAFDMTAGPPGEGVRAELDSYRAAVFLATVFALLGSAGVLIVLGLTIYTFVLPVLRGGDDRPGQTGPGVLWLISSFVFAGLLIAGLFLVRACVMVGVDAARTLRGLERDASASRRSR